MFHFSIFICEVITSTKKGSMLILCVKCEEETIANNKKRSPAFIFKLITLLIIVTQAGCVNDGSCE